MKITKGGRYSGLVSNSASTGGVGGVPVSGAPADGDTIVYDFTTNTFIYTTGGGSAIEVFNEGSSLTAALASLDFVGAGVTATNTGDAVTVTIPSTGIQLASITAASSAIAATEAVVVSASLAANSIVAGNSYRITGAGVGTTGVTPGTDTFRIRIGTTTLTGTIPTSTTALGVAAVTGQSFSFVAIITVRTGGGSGTIIGECVAFSANVATGRYATLNNLSATTASVAVDTTVTNLLELTFQSGNAGSSNTFHVASIEQLTVAAVAAGSGSNPLLAVNNYAPTSQTVLSTSGTAMQDVDATNMVVTFTAPASGNVLVKLSAFGDLNGGAGELFWGLRESTTNLTGICRIQRAATAEGYISVSIYLSGISAGSHTYKWSFGASTGTGRIIVQDGSAIGEWGPGVMEVWTAP